MSLGFQEKQKRETICSSLPKRRLSLPSHAMPFKTSMPYDAVKNPDT